MDFDFKMKLTGIGPHFNTELSSRVSSINMALYADNGSGKSFISKSFKRVTDLKYLDTTDPDKVSALIEKSSAMVRFGENKELYLYRLSQIVSLKKNCLSSLVQIPCQR